VDKSRKLYFASDGVSSPISHRRAFTRWEFRIKIGTSSNIASKLRPACRILQPAKLLFYLTKPYNSKSYNGRRMPEMAKVLRHNYMPSKQQLTLASPAMGHVTPLGVQQYICCYFTLELDKVSQQSLMSNMFNFA